MGRRCRLARSLLIALMGYVPGLSAQQYCMSGTVTTAPGNTFQVGDNIAVTANIKAATPPCTATSPLPGETQTVCTSQSILLDITSGAGHWTNALPNTGGGSLSATGISYPSSMVNQTLITLVESSELSPLPSSPGSNVSLAVAFSITYSAANLVAGGILPAAFPSPADVQAAAAAGSYAYFAVTDGSYSSYSISYTGQTCANPSLRILRDATDITDTTVGPPRPPQSVVVGQKIALTASLPTGAVLSPGQSWMVQGTTVGGFVVSFGRTSTGKVTEPDFTNASTIFYWTTPGTYQVTLSCTLSNGQTEMVHALFAVDGPTSPSVMTSLGTVLISNILLGFGNPAGVQGITFTSYVTHLPPSTDGAPLWVQLVDQLSIISTDFLGVQQSCLVSGGVLDTRYPAQIGPDESDSPGIVGLLQPLYAEVDFTFMARMYLMWDPLLPTGCTTGRDCTSIPVPLGFTSWGFSAVAQQGLTHEWSSSGSGSASNFEAGTTYPEWNKVVH